MGFEKLSLKRPRRCNARVENITSKVTSEGGLFLFVAALVAAARPANSMPDILFATTGLNAAPVHAAVQTPSRGTPDERPRHVGSLFNLATPTREQATAEYTPFLSIHAR